MVVTNPNFLCWNLECSKTEVLVSFLISGEVDPCDFRFMLSAFGFTYRLRVLQLVTWEHPALFYPDWLDVDYLLIFFL